MAGLAAAFELREAGREVTVLEAQSRVGGRVLTLRDFPEDLYAEAGALFIPDNHELTLRYVAEFGLSLDPFKAGDRATVRYSEGRRELIAADQEWLPGMVPDGQTEGEPDAASLARLIGDPSSPDWSPRSLERYDRMSYAEFLDTRGLEDSAKRPLVKFWGSLWGEGAETVSALAMLRDWVHLRGLTHEYRIRGGNDLLPKAFASRLGDSLWLGCRVVRIEQEENRVRVTFSKLGTHHTLEADRLICAIPFSVLRSVEIRPEFSLEKKRAIEDLPHFSACRISVLARNRFWRREGADGFAVTDLPIGQVFNMTGNQAGQRGVLQCYAGGLGARSISAMAEADRTRFVLAEMEKVYPGLADSAESFSVKDWDQDPFARGASSWFRPGQFSRLWPHLAKPEGRVHFAGDQTSAWIRWMQGALHSGLRAAREVLQAGT